MVDARIRSQRHGIERMQADALLPEEIRPETKPSGEAPRIALLTGACGFLGRHLARVLLNRTTEPCVPGATQSGQVGNDPLGADLIGDRDQSAGRAEPRRSTGRGPY